MCADEWHGRLMAAASCLSVELPRCCNSHSGQCKYQHHCPPLQLQHCMSGRRPSRRPHIDCQSASLLASRPHTHTCRCRTRHTHKVRQKKKQVLIPKTETRLYRMSCWPDLWPKKNANQQSVNNNYYWRRLLSLHEWGGHSAVSNRRPSQFHFSVCLKICGKVKWMSGRVRTILVLGTWWYLQVSVLGDTFFSTRTRYFHTRRL